MTEPILMVHWIDSHVYELYQVDDDHLPEPTQIYSVGYHVVTHGVGPFEYIVLAREKVGDDWRGLLVIPKVAIIDQVRLTQMPAEAPDGRRPDAHL